METPASAKSPASPASKSSNSSATALSPADAWQPLPASAFDASAARHLLRRATWSAQPDEVERAVREGLPATLARLFPEKPAAFPKPKLVERL